MKPKHTRMLLVGGALLVVAGAVALVLTALQDNIVFFHSPTDVVAKKIEPGRRFVIERPVLRPDHGADAGDARMMGEGEQTVPQHRDAAEPAILFRAVAAEAFSAAGGDDQRDGGHRWSLVGVRLSVVRRAKLHYFAVYCWAIGLLILLLSYLNVLGPTDVP